MTTMSLTALLGVLALALLSACVTSRRAKRRAETRREIEEELATKLRKAEQADEALVTALVEGVATDRAIADNQSARAAVIPTANLARPWDWEPDDLQRWKVAELRNRGEEINRALLVPTVGGALGLVAITVTVIVVQYQFFARTGPATAPAASSVPALPDAALPPPIWNAPAPPPLDSPAPADAPPAPAADHPHDASPKIPSAPPSSQGVTT